MKTKKLFAYSATLAAGASASAEVHRVILDEPLTVFAGAGINFSLSEGFADSSNAGATGSGEFRLEFARDDSEKPRISSNMASNGVLIDAGSRLYARKLEENDLISGSAGTFQEGLGINDVYLAYQKSPADIWKMGDRGYLGLQFEEEGTSLYGWADVEYSERSLTLYGFAYQDDGTGIRAGTVIPEPKTSALLGALVAGSAVMYGRRRKAAVKG